MTNKKDALKAEIKAELQSELAAQNGSPAALYVNVALLIAIGLVAGFIAGRTYERRQIQKSADFARHQMAKAQEVQHQHAGARAPRQSQPSQQGQQPPMAGGGDGAPSGAPMAQVMALRERLEKNPDDFEALVELARMETMIGRMDEAIDYLQRAAALQPSNVELLLQLGSVQHEAGHTDDAIETYQRAELADPKDPWRSQLALGVLYMAVKEDEVQALQYFEKYLANAPADDPYRESVEQEVARIKQSASAPDDGEAKIPMH